MLMCVFCKICMHLKKTAFSPYVCITQVTSGWSDFSSMFADGSKQKALTDTDEIVVTLILKNTIFIN